MTGELKLGKSRFVVTADVVAATMKALRERGLAGEEAVVVWIGHVDVHGDGFIERAYYPEQTAVHSDGGVGVHIDGDAITRLILALEDDERVLVRVHSHPGFAYHSETDDDNRLLSHEGAISVVVPYFARQGLRFEICSVNELVIGQGWVELPIDEVLRRFEVK